MVTNPQETPITTPSIDPPEGKYVHLIGPATLQVLNGGQQIGVILLRNDRTPINKDKPILFDPTLTFASIHLVAEFNPALFDLHHGTLIEDEHSFIELLLTENPAATSKFVRCMTSTDPPCRNDVRG